MSYSHLRATLIRGLRWASYLALRARRGHGLPKTKERWEELYQRGHWDYLNTAPELPHYMVAVGYILDVPRPPAVLDVGCGHGRLLDLLGRHSLSAYVGVDIAEDAIRRARRTAPPEARFVVADYEEFTPAGTFDVVVFNECLSYAPDPARTMQRYVNALADDGRFIVSLCYNWWQYPIWRSLARDFTTAHAASVTNELGQVWHIRMLHPRRRRHHGNHHGTLTRRDARRALLEDRQSARRVATRRHEERGNGQPAGSTSAGAVPVPLWHPVRATVLVAITLLDDLVVERLAARLERARRAADPHRLKEVIRSWWPIVLTAAASAAAALGLGAYALSQLLETAG